MFIYKGSKLENDIKELQKIEGMTNEEKAIKPYKDKILRLESELEKTKKYNYEIRTTIIKFIRNIKNQNYEAAIPIDKPTAEYYYGKEIQNYEMKIVTIPINEVFIKKLENKLCEIENQI